MTEEEEMKRCPCCCTSEKHGSLHEAPYLCGECYFNGPTRPDISLLGYEVFPIPYKDLGFDD